MTLFARTKSSELRFQRALPRRPAEESRPFRTLAVDLDLDGVGSLGECTRWPTIGETAETAPAALPRLLRSLQALGARLPSDRAPCWRGWNAPTFLMTDMLGNHASSRPPWTSPSTTSPGRVLGLPSGSSSAPRPAPRPTTRWASTSQPSWPTVPIWTRFPALEVEVGGPADIETLEAVHGCYGGPLRVDANTGWQPEQAVALMPELARLGVELVEQPFPARALALLRWLRERGQPPIMADSSARLRAGSAVSRGHHQQVVVELRQCGIVGPGLRMVEEDRRLGMKVMLSFVLRIEASASLPRPSSPPRWTGSTWTGDLVIVPVP